MAKDNTSLPADNQTAPGEHKKYFPFIKLSWLPLVFSAAIIIIGIVLYVKNGGFELGIDFLGGARIETKILTPGVTIGTVRNIFESVPGDTAITTLGAASDQHYLITLSGKEDQVEAGVATIKTTLENAYGASNVTILGSELVGPKMGKEFSKRAIQLLLIVALLILIYVAVRFDFFYGTGGVAALFHDMLVMASFAMFFNIRMDMTIVAAFLTILGYSINDTVVVFDRIREGYNNSPDEDYRYLMEKSIQETLSRTIITSLTTFFVALSITIWGGRVLHDFGLLLCVGILSGTYSSIWIASPITYILKKKLDRKKTHFADGKDLAPAKAKN